MTELFSNLVGLPSCGICDHPGVIVVSGLTDDFDFRMTDNYNDPVREDRRHNFHDTRPGSKPMRHQVRLVSNGKKIIHF